jgi:hypothetical protein
MTTRTVLAAIAIACLLAACTAQPPAQPAQPRPQQAGQPVDPLRTAAHITAARMAALTGDQAGVQRNAQAIADDMRRAIKQPDTSRPLHRETARTIARALPGVRSANWLDRHNLMVRVEGAHLRTVQTIDTLCWQLEPHGDTLGVVVHLQNTAPRNRDEMDTLSRNCQLAEGDASLFVRQHQVDVLDPALRAQHRASAEQLRKRPERKQTEADRRALEAIPEM